MYIRNLLNLRPSPEFESWLESMQIQKENKLLNYSQKAILDRLLISAKDFEQELDVKSD